MAVIKETVLLEGILNGAGRQRTCHVRAVRHANYTDECAKPICVSYSRCDVDDADDFPDGEYELAFEGHRVLLAKRAGQYVLR